MSIEDRYESLLRLYEAPRVGHRVRLLRVSREMSQSALARHLNTKPNTISQIENGLSRPAADVEMRLKAAFGITIDWLRFGELAGMSQEMLRDLDETEKRIGDKRTLNEPKRVARKFDRPARKVGKK